jgi:hypothetical protein
MPRTRLSTEADPAPWVRADTLGDCFLYWLPVSGYPARQAERDWLNAFLVLLTDALTQAAGLRCEVFLQMSVISEHVGEMYLRETHRIPKVTGLGRVPGQAAPAPPDIDDLKKAKTSGESFDLKEWLSAYVLWLQTGDQDRMRNLFAGYGGFLSIFLPPDPKTAPPVFNITPRMRRAMPVFQQQDVEGLIASAFSMRDGWLPRSKELFGEGMEQRTEFPGVPCVLPLLAAQHILDASPEFRTTLFDLFPVMVRESEQDRGVLLLFREASFEPLVLSVLDSMRMQDLVYPALVAGAERA